MRNRNTNSSGGKWTQAEIAAVWQKGQIPIGQNPAVFRRDKCNAWIRWDEYGQQTQNGWEIDHIKPVSKGGGDEISNLQPLYWENNRHKGDDWPQWTCAVSPV